MKHLKPSRLQAAAEGGALRPAERAHLHACADCQAELDAFTALLSELQAMPEPPRALDAAVMQRIGLAPKPSAWRWAWGFGGALAGALSLLFVLGRAPQPGARACGPSEPAAKPRRSCAPERRHRAEPAAEGAAPSLAQADPAPAPTRESGLSGQSEPALGQSATEPAAPQQRLRCDDAKSPTPDAPRALLLSVQNNLLKPGSGPLTVRLQLSAPGELNATIYDQRGRAVADLFKGPAAAGTETLRWDAAGAPSGPYTLLIRSQGQAQTVKLLVVR